MEEDHQEIINKLREIIEKLSKTNKVYSSFKYKPFKKKYEDAEIDILAIIGCDLYLFEVKSGSKENKAKEQLNFHKEQLINLKNILSLRNKISFSEVRLFRISGRDNIIENVETNEQMAFDPTFLENPLGFLTK